MTARERDFNAGVDAAKAAFVAVAAAIQPAHAIGRTALETIAAELDRLKFPGAGDQ
jgi:hypothetical protein